MFDDDSLMDAENLPEPKVLAAENAEDMRSAPEQNSVLSWDLGGEA